MMSMAITAGWYQDPEGPPSHTRWWDGRMWYERAPVPPPQPPLQPYTGPHPGPPRTRAVPCFGAYLLALFYPIVGLIWGIVCFTRNQVGPGLALISVSSLWMLAWFVYWASVAST